MKKMTKKKKKIKPTSIVKNAWKEFITENHAFKKGHLKS